MTRAIQSELAVIGVDRDELRWLRTLVWLLRHPDPSVPELARQALLYLTGAAEQRSEGVPKQRSVGAVEQPSAEMWPAG
jgi:hypothetical protein